MPSAKPVSRTQTWEFASDVQREAFQYGPYPQCAAGPFGSGKTTAYCRKLLWLLDTFPNSRAVVARRQRVDLAATTRPTFFKHCPPAAYANGRRNDQENILQLNNGSEVLWLYLDNPDLLTIIRGLEINFFMIDQAEEAPERMEENFDLLCKRLGRWDDAVVPQALLDRNPEPWPFRTGDGKPIPPPYAMLTCNPDLDTHWIYRRFHPDSLEYQASWRHLGYRLFEMDDNRFLSNVNKAELSRAHKGSIAVRSWGSPEGTLHSIDKASLIPGTPEVRQYLDTHCTFHRILNHGDAQPTCCLWAGIDAHANVIVYREYFKPHGLISDHRETIANWSKDESYEFNLANPKMFVKNQDNLGASLSIAEEYADVQEYARETALFLSAGIDHDLATRNRINEYLAIDPGHRNPFTKGRGAPSLYFITSTPDWPHGCVHVVQETKSQRREKIGTDGGAPVFSDKRLKVPEDAYACLRFLMAARAPHVLTAQATGPAYGTVDWYNNLHAQKVRLDQSRVGVR